LCPESPGGPPSSSSWCPRPLATRDNATHLLGRPNGRFVHFPSAWVPPRVGPTIEGVLKWCWGPNPWKTHFPAIFRGSFLPARSGFNQNNPRLRISLPPPPAKSSPIMGACNTSPPATSDPISEKTPRVLGSQMPPLAGPRMGGSKIPHNQGPTVGYASPRGKPARLPPGPRDPMGSL